MSDVYRNADRFELRKRSDEPVGNENFSSAHHVLELKSVQQRLCLRVVMEYDKRFIDFLPHPSDSFDEV